MLADMMAISYLQGTGQEYGAPLRMLLGRAIKEYKEKLGERERKDYEGILKNVYVIILKEEPMPEDFVPPPELEEA